MIPSVRAARAARSLVAAFEGALADGVRTADLGGAATTDDFTHAVLERLTSVGG